MGVDDYEEVWNVTAKPLESWISCHLYYHQDLDRAISGFVHPTVVSLLSSGWIGSFFFVRFTLGGPHVRLRLRAPTGGRGRVEEVVTQAAERFLASEPSTEPRAKELIRQETQSLLASDPFETDDTVYPDNTFSVLPFRPETERYGGPEHLENSLDFFAISSVEALRFLALDGAKPRARQLAEAFRLLLRQALGFAANDEDLFRLLDYAVYSWGESLPKIVEKGDRLFAAQEEVFCDLFRREIESLPGVCESNRQRETPVAPVLLEAARRLSRTIDRHDGNAWWRVGGSQMHMTANRLGLKNPEEVYLGRLMTRAGRALQKTETDLWRRLQSVQADSAAPTHAERLSLAHLLGPVFENLRDGFS